MAALAILAGIGAFCYLHYDAAIYALPFLVGVFVGLHAEQAGAGPLSGIALGIGAAVLVLVIGRALYGCGGRSYASRSHWSLRLQPRSQAILRRLRSSAWPRHPKVGVRPLGFWRQWQLAPSRGKGLPQRYRLPATTISAHSTARGTRAADLARYEFERHRLDADYDRGGMGPLARSPAAQNLTFLRGR